MPNIISVMRKDFVRREGVRLGYSKKEAQATHLPAICLHNIVKRYQVIAMVVSNIDSTYYRNDHRYFNSLNAVHAFANLCAAHTRRRH